MGTYLDEILDSTRARLEASKRRVSISDLEKQAEAQGPPRDFVAAILAPEISLVAEIKWRSPSAGEIRSGAEPGPLAQAYEKGGARAISVLTEPQFFAGALSDMSAARDAANLPVLRKDFLLDLYQIVEARAAGADAVLLIAAAINDRALMTDLLSAASGFEMGVLVEIHDHDELEEALEVGAQLIGINQRDLTTFEVDKGLAARLRRQVPGEIPVIAESGIATRADVAALEKAGLDGVLVGEALMRSSDPGAAVAELLGLG